MAQSHNSTIKNASVLPQYLLGDNITHNLTPSAVIRVHQTWNDIEDWYIHMIFCDDGSVQPADGLGFVRVYRQSTGEWVYSKQIKYAFHANSVAYVPGWKHFFVVQTLKKAGKKQTPTNNITVYDDYWRYVETINPPGKENLTTGKYVKDIDSTNGDEELFAETNFDKTISGGGFISYDYVTKKLWYGSLGNDEVYTITRENVKTIKTPRKKNNGVIEYKDVPHYKYTLIKYKVGGNYKEAEKARNATTSDNKKQAAYDTALKTKGNGDWWYNQDVAVYNNIFYWSLPKGAVQIGSINSDNSWVVTAKGWTDHYDTSGVYRLGETEGWEFDSEGRLWVMRYQIIYQESSTANWLYHAMVCETMTNETYIVDSYYKYGNYENTRMSNLYNISSPDDPSKPLYSKTHFSGANFTAELKYADNDSMVCSETIIKHPNICNTWRFKPNEIQVNEDTTIYGWDTNWSYRLMLGDAKLKLNGNFETINNAQVPSMRIRGGKFSLASKKNNGKIDTNIAIQLHPGSSIDIENWSNSIPFKCNTIYINGHKNGVTPIVSIFKTPTNGSIKVNSVKIGNTYKSISGLGVFINADKVISL